MTDQRAYSPLVRQLAAEHGVNLAAVNGTGIGGEVTKLDVLAAGASPSAIAAAVTRGAITPARVPAFESMAAENPRAMVRPSSRSPATPARSPRRAAAAARSRR